MTRTNKIAAYLRIMRFDRPIGILLLLWPTLWALWIAARGVPPTKILIIFIIGVVLMRAAGCIINDYADRHFDGLVARTKNRPLVTGAVSVKGAITLFILLCLIAFILVCFLNKLTILLALVAVALACCYPFMKRFFAIPQLALGLAFSWSIPMAFAAVNNRVPLVAWLLFLATFFWIVAYDTQYAMVDRDDDIKIGIKSSAIFFGSYDRLWVVISQFAMLITLVVIGGLLGLNLFYYCALLLSAGLMIYQFCLIYRRKPANCFKAFLNNNWVGALIFIGVYFNFN